MGPTMSTDKPPQPTSKQLAHSARELMEERVLDQGGKKPSPKVLRAASLYLANKAQREATK